jgi:hypothetical protein
VVRAECVSEQVSLQSSLTNGLRPPFPPLGDFTQSFPDVADLAKHLQTLSIKDLQIFFHTEKFSFTQKWLDPVKQSSFLA